MKLERGIAMAVMKIKTIKSVDLKQICHSKLKNKNRKYQKYDKMFLTTKTLSNWRYFL